ncbi:MAG TPA: hypothetical protein VN915_06465 [Elusimicrobiota bacterium]|nr:hypothetical protein [Elusimicrobiota bacterium]
MKKSSLLLAVLLGAAAAPAFATHPNEVCRIAIDVAAAAKSVGADPSSVRVRYVFNGGVSNMTDMTPPPSETSARPAEGPWIFKTDLHSNLYFRSLAAVKIESLRYNPDDGKPEWSVTVDRAPEDAAQKGAPIVCEQYAD